jgi:hypothetical protein
LKFDSSEENVLSLFLQVIYIYPTEGGMWFVIRARVWLQSLNLFESGSLQNLTIKSEKWSTRLYLALLFLSLFFLVFYTAIAERTVNTLVKNPSYDMFNSLQNRYGDTLKCPCSTIAIQYRTFVTLEPKFHQVQSLD